MDSAQLSALAELGMRARVPIAVAHEMLRAAIEASGDQDLGLKAARTTEYGHFEVLEYAAGTAATWRQAFQVMVKLAPLVNDAAQFRFEVDGDHALLVFASRVPLSRTAADFCSAAFWIAIQRWLDGEMLQGEVWLAHPEPQDLSEYRKSFGQAKLLFDTAENALLLPAPLLEQPLRRADNRLHGVLMAHAERLLVELPRVESLSERVRRGITETMPDGTVSAERVAAMLNMSRRTLSRQLGAEGTSFRALLEEVRQRFAKHYLESTNMGAADIAFMLGFSQSAAFVRAFRRWTGCAPGEYRRRLRP